MDDVRRRGPRVHRSARTARLLLALVALVLLAAGAAALAAGPAAAKDFTITSVRVDATVKPNGDVRITDTRTLDFSGSFHFVYWDLSTRGSEGIEVLGASGPAAGDAGTTVPYEPAPNSIVGMQSGDVGTYAVEDKGSIVTVQLNFEVTDAIAIVHRRLRGQGRSQTLERHG